MTYSLKPNPEVLAPLYWGGIDIKDPEPFTPEKATGIPPSPSVGFWEELSGVVSLSTALGSAKRNGYSERTNSFGPEFNPNGTHLKDGTVVILEEEWLRGHFTPDGEPTVCPDVDASSDDEPTAPISKPYLRYWADNVGEPGIGHEAADFDGGTIHYDRTLSWGVLKTEKDDTRKLVTFNFDNPDYNDRGKVDVEPRHKPDRTATRLPITIGEVVTLPEGDDEIRSRDMIRLIGISIVPPPGTGERNKDRKRLAEQVRDWVRARSGVFLPQPQLQPVPVYKSNT